MRAISAFSRDAGMSTRVCLAVTALRIRVSISAIGSVIVFVLSSSQLTVHSSQWSQNCLPTALGHARHVAFERQLAKAEAAQRELPQVAARAAAQAAAVAQADLVLRRLLFLRDLRGRRHLLIPAS